MQNLFQRATQLYFIVATVFLMLLAMLLLANAVWEVVTAVTQGEAIGILDSIGLVIIGFAIVETAKFFAEEEILRQQELRSAVESRRSLTKFVTIIVIAASLEALVMIFETSRTDVTHSIYPAALFAAAMFALIALGIFQWLSSRIALPPEGADVSRDAKIDHHAPRAEEAETAAKPSPRAPKSGGSGRQGKA